MISDCDTIETMTSSGKLRTKLQQGSKLSCQEVRRLLKDLGYRLARQKGSHEQWVYRGSTFTLACHGKDCPQYLLEEIKKLIGVIK
jgi:predicted RNA binding protein YcfA (HicA-like mRNA interferase family)